MDGHAPMKRKNTVKYPITFMDSKLHKACLNKAMLRKKLNMIEPIFYRIVTVKIVTR